MPSVRHESVDAGSPIGQPDEVILGVPWSRVLAIGIAGGFQHAAAGSALKDGDLAPGPDKAHVAHQQNRTGASTPIGIPAGRRTAGRRPFERSGPARPVACGGVRRRRRPPEFQARAEHARGLASSLGSSGPAMAARIWPFPEVPMVRVG